ncbi:MAG: hypothetical protein ACYSSL_01595 [Planctomycetota bacterium]|jgi:hypothetical protein
MTLISSGIDKVRAFELPAGIGGDGRCVDLPRVALVKWHSTWNDKFYQIYVNGRYSGATIEPGQRQIIIQVPTSLEAPVRIEIFAVEAGDAEIDFSSELDWHAGESGRVRISLLRSQDLPIGSTVQVYYDNRTGQINYDNPLNNVPEQIWPTWQYKAGFGMSRFGVSDFGYDSAAAIGFGKGCFGHGQFGLDADKFEWVSASMPAGIYKFTVKITSDKDENQLTLSVS